MTATAALTKVGAVTAVTRGGRPEASDAKTAWRQEDAEAVSTDSSEDRLSLASPSEDVEWGGSSSGGAPASCRGSSRQDWEGFTAYRSSAYN